ncbi:hypothetical protein BH23CHL5_BH23CHL5_11770 [soil metagenome]
MTKHSGNNPYFISALSSPLLNASQFTGFSRRTQLSGVEIDVTDALRLRLQRWESASAADLSAVGIIWFPPPLERDLPGSVQRLLNQRNRGGVPLTIVVDQPRRKSMDSFSKQIQLAIRLRTVLPANLRIAVGVRPFQIENTRAHLANLATLRLQASEWDLDVALDLGRELDWLWEAEAAIYRLAGSLQLIRFSYPRDTFDGRFRASLTQRTIASCADIGYSGAFSLVVPLPWWHWKNQPSLEAACRNATFDINRRLSGDRGGTVIHEEVDRLADRN